MSIEENATQEETVQAAVATPPPAEAPKNAAANVVGSFLGLKQSNPKVFFGAIGGVAALLLFMMMGGDDAAKPTISGPAMKDLVIGQRYILKSANAYDASATVRLVSTPGAIAAYDDTEEADRNGACQHMPQGTPVSVLEFAEAYGKQKTYSKVRVEDGDCKGTELWALSIDVQ
ncbi:MAG: hypothetical protein HOP34_12255 [Methylococcaceae bacterium]|nr:hypothetical protein [Methylococcaceae bacterium]